MNIEKAIKTNKALLDGTYDHRDKGLEDALKLGIEAMKRHQYHLQNPMYWPVEPLPGETKE